MVSIKNSVLSSLLIGLSYFVAGQAAHRNAHAHAEVTATVRNDRVSSFPYISGDSFRQYADFIVDETRRPFDPLKVFPGAVVFVKTDMLETFFTQFHPQITCRYILLTHNSDFPIPGAHARYLDDPKIIAWFGQNVEGYAHAKLHVIPIGIANRCWPHGDINVYNRARSMQDRFQRKYLAYMNFEIGTNAGARAPVYRQFEHAPYCLKSGPKALYPYLLDVAQTKFVISPFGNGLDCHRTWEALLMGAIPVVQASTLDPMYEGLPVLIVRNWSEVTEAFLVKKYHEMSNKKYDLSRMYAQYWFTVIDGYKK